MKILHFAIENFARIPANMVAAEKKLGHESYLLIPYKPANYFQDEDFSLDLPFVGKKIYNKIKPLLGYNRIANSNTRVINKENHTWSPENRLFATLFSLRDSMWENRIRHFLKEIKIDTFDVIFLDGGAGFLRNGKIIKELKNQGTKIIITYCGSDFRSRGPIKVIEQLADYRLTFEHDHKIIDPDLDFYFAPFTMPTYSSNKTFKKKGIIRIGHAPTNRMAKGTDKILFFLSEIQKEFPIEVVLIENVNHQQALILKASCDIFIDNIGEIGYGINSLESLSMGIPTAVQIMPDMLEWLLDHPFINVNENNFIKELIPLITSEDLRKKYSQKGKIWVDKFHNPLNISQEIIQKISGLY